VIPEHASRKRQIWWTIGILFALVFALHLFQVSISQRDVLGGNERAHVKLLHSMVVQGTLAIDPPADVSFYKGRHYSNKPPGFAITMAPVYATYVAISGDQRLDSTFLFAKYANALISAGAVVLIYLLLASFSLSPGAVLFGVAAATIGTIFPAYSCLANSLPISILLCVGVLLAARKTQLQPDSMVLRAIVLFVGSLAIAVDYANIFFLFPVLIWVCVDVLKRRELWPLLAGLIPAMFVLGYNAIAFENPFTVSYAHYQPPSYVPWEGVAGSFSLLRVPRGLFGLLLSPGRGLFILSPVALIGAWALYRQAQSREFDRLWLAAPIATGILVMSAYALWHGGHSIGYRHILVAGFVLAALSAFVFESASRVGRMAALALLVVSSVSGIGSFWVQLDPTMLRLSWKAEPADVHASYYTELLIPKLTGRRVVDPMRRKRIIRTPPTPTVNPAAGPIPESDSSQRPSAEANGSTGLERVADARGLKLR
jgi:hypothetical protein